MHQGRYESFLVRVWAEGGRIVRSKALDLVSGESRGFVEVGGLVDFLTRQVARRSGRSVVRLPILFDVHRKDDESPVDDARRGEDG